MFLPMIWPIPLYGLLRRIRDESLDPKYRDFLRIAALPYLHPRAFSRRKPKVLKVRFNPVRNEALPIGSRPCRQLQGRFWPPVND
jgi:hypothetical protein